MPTSTRPSRRALALGLAWLLLLALAPGVAPGQGPDAAAPPAVDLDAGAAGEARGPTFFAWMVEASGPIGAVLLLMSIYLVALVVWMSVHFRRTVALPPPLTRDLADLLEQRRYGDAFQRVQADPSYLARVVAAGVRKLPSGVAHAQRAMERAIDDQSMGMEHRTTYLATVGTLGPMIGLVGTVYGMIIAFKELARADASPQASALAAGISTALFATLEGIALAIPAIYFHAMFRNRIARLGLEVEQAAETILEQFTPGVRTPHPLAASATAAPPSARPFLPSGPPPE